MIIMTLDHVRDLMHTTSITNLPNDLSTASPALFFTRWITHLCAPTFVFLSGTSACLSIRKNGSSQFLITRGLWLILLDLTLVNFGVWFDPHFKVFLFDVLSAIGCGFIVLSLFVKAPPKVIALTGLAIIFLHGLVSFLSVGASLPGVIRSLFLPGAFPVGSSIFVMGYPPVPWLGIMLISFAAGRVFDWEEVKRKSFFLRLGLLSIALFMAIRFINIYGDSAPWSVQKNNLYTVLSFLNLTKYPPSLDFCLLFLGFMFLLLSLFQGTRNRLTDIACVYGKVPLFYFLVHWYIIHPLVFLMVYLEGYTVSDFVFGFNFGRPKGPSGIDLWLVYLVWIAIVIALYPVCRWYARYKENNRQKTWLRYL